MAYRGGRGRGRGHGGGDGFLKKENESLDIERFSDVLKPKTKLNKSGYFYDYLILRPDNFPKELLGDVQRDRPAKRAKWSMDADLKKLELFEKLEAKLEAEGKEDNDEEEEGEDEVEESDDNGDYDQTLTMMTTIITSQHPMAILKLCIKKFLLPEEEIKFCNQEKLGIPQALVL